MQEIIFITRHFKEDHQKSFKKLTLFFLSKPVPFNGQSYQKQKGPGASDQSLLRLQNELKKVLYWLYVI